MALPVAVRRQLERDRGTLDEGQVEVRAAGSPVVGWRFGGRHGVPARIVPCPPGIALAVVAVVRSHVRRLRVVMVGETLAVGRLVRGRAGLWSVRVVGPMPRQMGERRELRGQQEGAEQEASCRRPESSDGVGSAPRGL